MIYVIGTSYLRKTVYLDRKLTNPLFPIYFDEELL